MMTNHIIHPLITCYGKTVICEENKFQLNLAKRCEKRSDLSHFDHKCDLIYCQWNTTVSAAVCSVSFLMFSL